MLKQSFIYYFKFAKYALIFVVMRVILKIRFKMLWTVLFEPYLDITHISSIISYIHVFLLI